MKTMNSNIPGSNCCSTPTQITRKQKPPKIPVNSLPPKPLEKENGSELEQKIPESQVPHVSHVSHVWQ